jgi:hypothetical protein
MGGKNGPSEGYLHSVSHARGTEVLRVARLHPVIGTTENKVSAIEQ